MGSVAIFLIVVATALIAAGVSARIFRGRKVATGEAHTREGRRATVRGAVACDLPLRSPVTGTPALAYTVEIIATWRDGDRLRTATADTLRRVASFELDDGSGEVAVRPTPQDRLFPLVHRFDEGRSVSLANSVTGRPECFGEEAFPVDCDIVPGGVDHLRVVEKVVPIPSEATVVGEVRAGAMVRSRHRRLWIDGTAPSTLKMFTERFLPSLGETVMQAVFAVRDRVAPSLGKR